jgi:hypothetical protein
VASGFKAFKAELINRILKNLIFLISNSTTQGMFLNSQVASRYYKMKTNLTQRVVQVGANRL